MISIVDDDEFVRTRTVDLLASLGYSAVAFESAESFLDSGQVNDTVCLILDQHLPGLTGSELQNQLSIAGSQTAIIFITAFAEPQHRERALKAGAVAYLAKPYADTDLIAALKTALSRR